MNISFVNKFIYRMMHFILYLYIKKDPYTALTQSARSKAFIIYRFVDFLRLSIIFCLVGEICFGAIPADPQTHALYELKSIATSLCNNRNMSNFHASILRRAMGKEGAAQIKSFTDTTSAFESSRVALLTKIQTVIDVVTAELTALNESFTEPSNDESIPDSVLAIQKETMRIKIASYIAELTAEMRDLLQNFVAQYPTMIYKDFLQQTGGTEFLSGITQNISTMFRSTVGNTTKHDEQTDIKVTKALENMGSTPHEFVFLYNVDTLPTRLRGHIDEIKHLFAYKSFSPQELYLAQMPVLSSVYLFGRALEAEERETVASCVRSGALARLHIPLWGAEEIAANAFKNSVNLTELIGFTDLKTIGNSAFQGCTGLHKLTLPNTVQIVGDNAFADTTIGEMFISDGITNFASTAFTDAVIGKFNFQEGITNITYIKNIITPVTCTFDVHFPGSLGSVSAFSDSQLKIQNISCGNGITTISSSTFRLTKITKVTLPSTIVSIFG
jgi:hypothetical protein